MRQNIVISLAGVLLATLSFQDESASQSHPSSESTFKTDEQRLGLLHREMLSQVLSKDGRHHAYVTVNSGKAFVVVDGKSGQGYDGIMDGTLTLSEDGKRVAYAAKRGEKLFMVMDGKELSEHDGIASGVLAFAPDGKRLAYAARTGDKWFVVLDGKAGPEFDKVMKGSLLFTQDGTRLVYAAGNRGRYFVVVDGKPEREYDGLAMLTLSPNGKRVAYAVKKGSGLAVVLDGQEEFGYDGIGKDSLGFSPDSKRFGYAARKGTKWFAVIDGQAGPEYDSAGRPIFSHDGRQVAYWAETNKKQFVVVDGRPGREYDSVAGTIRFSSDGRHLAYAAQSGANWTVVLDGTPGPLFDTITEGSIVFSPDGKRLGYGAKKGGKYLAVVDGKATGSDYDGVGDPAFDATGTHVAFVAEKDGRQFVVINGTPGPAYDAFVGQRLGFQADGTLEYLGVKDGVLYRVKHIPEGTIVKGAAGRLRLEEKTQPKRKSFASVVLNLPEGEVRIGDRKVWTRFGLTIADAVWEGNPNEARGNWGEILLSLNNGEVRKETCVETSGKANFLSVFDRKNKTSWWVPFEAIRQIKVAEATSKSLEGLERITEIYGRFRFSNEPMTISDIKASVEVKLLHPFGKKEYVLRGLVIGTLHFRAVNEWRDVPWSSISTIEFQRNDKSTRADQITLYTYRMQANYSNLWKEYALPTESEDKTEPKEPNQLMEPDAD